VEKTTNTMAIAIATFANFGSIFLKNLAGQLVYGSYERLISIENI